MPRRAVRAIRRAGALGRPRRRTDRPTGQRRGVAGLAADETFLHFARLVAYSHERGRLQDLVLEGLRPGTGAHHGGRFFSAGDIAGSSVIGPGRQRNRCVNEGLRGR
ncbi:MULTISPECIES: hypothetical protein [Streptomyces]|uniref:hypothetical protein n=1 Tax=Streptomyces TaxID=1883 RepID=UPI0029AF3130|nr:MULTISPECIES: hypothetical protein [unclassified Streptomyces]MDX2548443.1 hypothetical protein [Streptomyces sp. WI04-05B]MDX2587426.1 hypothetical protein [Streptomyces sp. WI04-05A]